MREKITLTIDNKQKELLEKLKKETGLPMSRVIEQALFSYLKEKNFFKKGD